jgi:hypothetical protein
MMYSAWGVDGVANTFVEGNLLPEQQRQMEPDLQLIKLFEASWNDSMRQYHKWQGWEPYKPMLNANGEEYPEDSSPSPDRSI